MGISSPVMRRVKQATWVYLCAKKSKHRLASFSPSISKFMSPVGYTRVKGKGRIIAR